MQNIVTSLDKNEVYRYLGYRGADIPERLDRLTDRCIELTLGTISPKGMYKIFDIFRTDGGILLDGTDVTLTGNDIADHLAGCVSAALMCATVGAELDRLIKVKMLTDPDQGVILDSCGTVAAERAADHVEDEVKRVAADRGLNTTWRYSPGYGDLPIELQRDILRVLDSYRRIGLTVTDSMLMTPAKSVSAIIGIGDLKRDERPDKCDYCANNGNCEFRRNNTRC